MGQKQAEKGAYTEEILRRYFLEQGFFVVRGLVLRQGSSYVTDVDLWLYQRPSAMVRQTLVVDARYRARPQAMERIIWAAGIRALTGVERCVVATPDSRSDAKELAAKADVLILDGNVLSRLEKHFTSAGDRLTEEELAREVFPQGDHKLLGDWRRKIEESKSHLLERLNFDGCNAWLEDAKYFLDLARFGLPRADSALRAAYLNLSFFLIGLDWATRDMAFADRDVRAVHLEDGFRHGAKGAEGFENVVRTAGDLILQYNPGMSGTVATMRNRAHQDLQRLPAKGLAEFLVKNDVYTKLFPMANAFERAAFDVKLKRPQELDVPLQAILGAVLDFHSLSRDGLLGSTTRDGELFPSAREANKGT